MMVHLLPGPFVTSPLLRLLLLLLLLILLLLRLIRSANGLLRDRGSVGEKITSQELQAVADLCARS